MKNPYETLGVAKNASGRRDQEGLPQARPPVPPRQEPGRRCRRGALQGGAERLRPALRAGEAGAVRPLRLHERTRPGPGRRRVQLVGDRGRRLRRPERPVRRDVRGALRRWRPALPRAARQRRRGPGQPVVRGRAERGRGQDPGHARGRVPHVPRLGREAGDGAEGLPAVRRSRCDRREPGLLRALPAVPPLPRERLDHRGAVPDLPRRRPRAADEALHGEDPRGRQGRLADPPEGQGRGGLERRAGR